MNTTVPFLDVGATYRELRDEIDIAYRRVMDSGWFLLGPELEAFETSWAEYCGVSHAAGVASGLDALVLALRALDVGPGDEVIVPSHTFIATWLAVTAVGATIVPVEPDSATYNITGEAVAAALTPRTAAVMPVHLYGLPADVHGIDEVARAARVPVIYDAAQAHGARVDGVPVGRFGTISAWSFYPGKNLGAFGDGGAVTSDDKDLIARIKQLRNYGSQVKYQHENLGVNSRLDEFQAAVLSVKLTRLDEWNARRQFVADAYCRGLADLDVVLPAVPDGMSSSWHLFVVASEERDRTKEALASKGVETGIHYPVPCHQQRAYSGLGLGPFPMAEHMSSRILSLPIGPHIPESHVTRVVECLVGASTGR